MQLRTDPSNLLRQMQKCGSQLTYTVSDEVLSGVLHFVDLAGSARDWLAGSPWSA